MRRLVRHVKPAQGALRQDGSRAGLWQAPYARSKHMGDAPTTQTPTNLLVTSATSALHCMHERITLPHSPATNACAC
jgi:hypothetical protein